MRNARPLHARLKRPNGELIEPTLPIRPVIIKVKEWDEESISSLLDRVGHPEVHRISELNLLRLEPPPKTRDADYKILLDTLRADPIVVHAYVLDPAKIIGRPHGNVVRTVVTNDAQMLFNQYHLLRHDFFGAWRYTKGSGGKIGVTDSGTTPEANADIREPDFKRNYDGVVGGNCMDAAYQWDGGTESHGTSTSSEISMERSGNGINGSAAAPDCTIYFGQMVNALGWWDPYVAMGHHVWMANAGCKAINTSWGYFVNSSGVLDSGWPSGEAGESVAQLISDFQASMDYCWNHGCLVINAPNDYGINLGIVADIHRIWGNLDMELPEMNSPTTKMPHCFVVGGISAMADMYAAICRGAWGPMIDMVAAGEEIWLMGTYGDQFGNYLGVGYVNGAGTSFAAPLVTAAVGLMAAVNSNLSPQDIWDILMAAGDDFRIETTPEFYLNMPSFMLSAPVVLSSTVGLLWTQGNGLNPVVGSSAGGAGDGGGWGINRQENMDGSIRNPALSSATRWTEAPQFTQEQSHTLHPQTYLFPNAKVLNAAKAVLMALSRANPGNIYPYVQAWGPGHLWRATGNSYYDGYRTKMFTWNQSAGTMTTTLDGHVALEVRGYSTDPITSVELWVGATKVYDGPPKLLRCAAISAGNPQAFTVVARTATGSTSDTLTDFIVDSLTVLDDFPMYQSWYDIRQDASYSTLPPPLNTTTTFHPSFSTDALYSPIGAVTTLFSTAFNVDAIALDRQTILRRGARLGASYLYGDPAGNDLWTGLVLHPGMNFSPNVVTKRAVSFGVRPVFSPARTVSGTRGLSFASHAGFLDTSSALPGRAVAFAVHPYLVQKGKVDSYDLMRYAAHVTAAFSKLTGVGVRMTYSAHAGMLLDADIPNESLLYATIARFLPGASLTRQNTLRLPAHPRMAQVDLLGALEHLTLTSSNALTVSFIRERTDIIEEGVTVEMALSYSGEFAAVGRLPLQARVGLALAATDLIGTSHIEFAAHPRLDLFLFVPTDISADYVKTLYTLALYSPGGTLIERVTVVADNDAQARHMVMRRGVGHITIEARKPVYYYDNPMEELELTTHYKGE